MKYIISYKTKFGSISAESDYADDLLVGYQTLKQLASKLENSILKESHQVLKSVSTRKASLISVSSPRQRSIRKKTGRGETTYILRELESKLLPTSFFQRPRSTGDTKAKLDEVSRSNFTSRKVSQALGILWKKGQLKRTGTRNYFVYSK